MKPDGPRVVVERIRVIAGLTVYVHVVSGGAYNDWSAKKQRATVEIAHPEHFAKTPSNKPTRTAANAEGPTIIQAARAAVANARTLWSRPNVGGSESTQYLAPSFQSGGSIQGRTLWG